MFGEQMQDCSSPPYHIDSKQPLITYLTERTPMLNGHAPSFFSNISVQSLDCSIGNHLGKNNAMLIKRAIISYLRQCLEYPDKKQNIDPNQLFMFDYIQEEAKNNQSQLDIVIVNNPLLTEEDKITLGMNIQIYSELGWLFEEILEQIGLNLAHEVVFIMTRLLSLKLDELKKLSQPKQIQVIPIFQRFFGYQNEQITLSQPLNIDDQVNPTLVRKVSSIGIDDVGHNLYFSRQIKYLNLKDTKLQLKSGVQIRQHFNSLINYISKNLMMTMAGMIESEEQLQLYLDQLRPQKQQKKLKSDY